LLAACGGGSGVGGDAGAAEDAASDALIDAEAAVDATPDATVYLERQVRVTLDGEPLPNALVTQGGTDRMLRTDERGELTIQLDPSVVRPWWVIASHPDARIEGIPAYATSDEPLIIELLRFDASDNEDYLFQHPGTPDQRADTSYCAHCHITIGEDWYASPHRTAASNPVLHDVYAGTAHELTTREVCEMAGGQWRTGRGPNGARFADQCFLGGGVLSDGNASCDPGEPCDPTELTEYGGCADCHAPSINGELGGRDLLEAEGISHDFGVHCDVCHKVAGVDLDQPPGVAGRLQIIRPSEPTPSRLLAPDYAPLMFGPLPDVVNPRMGSVYRETHRQAAFCAGCHELDQSAHVLGTSIDESRWPGGVLPSQSTYSEWLAGPLSDAAPCQGCHMPPDPDVMNASDLQMFRSAEGASGGWPRPAGTVRRHVWAGPRQPEFEMLRLAAALFVERRVEGGELQVDVRVRNAGAGHAIPTGEPMRNLILTIEASCDGAALASSGGDVVPDFGGYHELKERGEDWTRWEDARVGQVIRVVRRLGDFHDYDGVAPFRRASMSIEERGMERETLVAERRIVGITEGVVVMDSALPDGDLAYLADAVTSFADGASSSAVAGAPGFGFARVMVDAAGRRMGLSHRGVDIASDNRLMPQAEWNVSHRFAATCAEPVVRARLVHRAYPYRLARERHWTMEDSMMTEETR